MNYRERVGGNLRYYRKINNLTMKEVADKVGVTLATIQKYEAGNIKTIDIDMLERLASAIGVTSRQLTGYQSDEEEHEAHLERIVKRETKWFAKYRELPYEKQKIVNEIIESLNESQKNDKSNEEEEILRKLRYITDEARSRIINQLNYEYEAERKKQERDFAS